MKPMGILAVVLAGACSSRVAAPPSPHAPAEVRDPHRTQAQPARPLTPSDARQWRFRRALRKHCPGAGKPQNPEAWLVIDPTQKDAAWLHAARNTICEWRVSRAGDHLSATLDEPAPNSLPFPTREEQHFGTPSAVLEVGNGFLLGFDRGEFGGALAFYTQSGRQGAQILRRNTVGLVETPFGIFALTGLRHLSVDSGQLVELVPTGGAFSRGRYVNVDARPGAWIVENSATLLIATTSELVRVSAELGVRKLYSGMWRSPNSAVLRDETIYLGIHGGIARVRRAGKEFIEEWLVPADPPGYEEGYENNDPQ